MSVAEYISKEKDIEVAMEQLDFQVEEDTKNNGMPKLFSHNVNHIMEDDGQMIYIVTAMAIFE